MNNTSITCSKTGTKNTVNFLFIVSTKNGEIFLNVLRKNVISRIA